MLGISIGARAAFGTGAAVAVLMAVNPVVPASTTAVLRANGLRTDRLADNFNLTSLVFVVEHRLPNLGRHPVQTGPQVVPVLALTPLAREQAKLLTSQVWRKDHGERHGSGIVP